MLRLTAAVSEYPGDRKRPGSVNLLRGGAGAPGLLRTVERRRAPGAVCLRGLRTP
jgi:hypothetical protein